MDIPSKIKLLRNSVSRFSDVQLKVMKNQAGRAVAKTVKLKERQSEANKINDEILEEMEVLLHFVQMGGKDREYQNLIMQRWDGYRGQPGLTDLIEKHGKLNGYGEEDIEERKDELFQELEDKYERLYG